MALQTKMRNNVRDNNRNHKQLTKAWTSRAAKVSRSPRQRYSIICLRNSWRRCLKSETILSPSKALSMSWSSLMGCRVMSLWSSVGFRRVDEAVWWPLLTLVMIVMQRSLWLHRLIMPIARQIVLVGNVYSSPINCTRSRRKLIVQRLSNTTRCS